MSTKALVKTSCFIFLISVAFSCKKDTPPPSSTEKKGDLKVSVAVNTPPSGMGSDGWHRTYTVIGNPEVFLRDMSDNLVSQQFCPSNTTIDMGSFDYAKYKIKAQVQIHYKSYKPGQTMGGSEYTWTKQGNVEFDLDGPNKSVNVTIEY